MPAVSEKQKRLMDAAAHNPAFAKKVGIPQNVAEEFSSKSKGAKFGSGAPKTRADRQEVNKPKTDHGDAAFFKNGGHMATKMNPGFMAMMAKKKAGAKKMATGGSVDVGNSTSMGKVRTASPSKDGVASKGKTKGTQIVMAGNKGMKKGGMAKAKC
jgi:hypothetical protein